jgi:hypothetical protein
VAIVIGVGNLLGQFSGPLIVGYLKSISTDYALSLGALGVSAIIGGLLIAASITKEEWSRKRDPLLERPVAT